MHDIEKSFSLNQSGGDILFWIVPLCLQASLGNGGIMEREMGLQK